jgi:hypothetical protein
MQVKICKYSASTRADVQAFVDLELDGWLRINGLHLQRDNTIKSAQLTPLRDGRRVFLPAIEIVDAERRELLTGEILAAIRAHMETLPPEKREKPVRPVAPRVLPAQPQAQKSQTPKQEQPTQAQPEKTEAIEPPLAKPTPPAQKAVIAKAPLIPARFASLPLLASRRSSFTDY